MDRQLQLGHRLFVAVFVLAIIAAAWRTGSAQVVGNGVSPCLGAAGCSVVSTTPTPVPATPPPLRYHMAWFNELGAEGVNSMMTATSAQITQYAMFCVGAGKNTPGNDITSCPGANGMGGWVQYMEGLMGEPNVNGHDVDFPYNGGYVNAPGKTCDAAASIVSGKFWAQQTSVTIGSQSFNFPNWTGTTSDNWGTYAAGGTTGDVNYLGFGWTGTIYYVYINPNSPGVLAYGNDVIAKCRQNATSSAFDSIGWVMHDNIDPGLQSATWDIWDRYTAGRNFGNSTSSGTYADPRSGASGSSFVPTAFFNGASHTRVGAITASDTPATFPADTSYELAQKTYLAGLKHANGSAMFVGYNGWLNTRQAINQNANTRVGIGEEVMIGCFGTCPSPQPLPYNGPTQAEIKDALGYQSGIRTAINDYAASYQETVKSGINPNFSGMLLADQSATLWSSTSGSPVTGQGTGIYQQNMMWEYAPIFAMYADDAPRLTAEWSDMCGFGAGSTSAVPNCIDVYAPDFAMPSGRITPYPADTTDAGGFQGCGEGFSGGAGYDWEGTNRHCGLGGSYDSVIQCPGAPTGVFCFEFSHFWYCPAQNDTLWPGCASDWGPLAIVINGSGSSVAVTALNVAAWFPHIYTSLAHIIAFCQPAANYWGSGSGAPIYAMPGTGDGRYGTDKVCVGNTGMDSLGGNVLDRSKALLDVTSNSQLLYPGQVGYFSP